MITLSSLNEKWPSCAVGLDSVAARHPFRLSTYYGGLIQAPGDPVWLQAVPSVQELADSAGCEDPLGEEGLSPVPNLVHRYDNRVLWLVSEECAVHCRFCTRKRRWGVSSPLSDELLQEGLLYIRGNTRVKDVLLSGGDPLLLPPSRLELILAALRRIPHVEIIRIGTRVPCALPARVTGKLAKMLSRYHPLYVNIHFNHPRELTEKSRAACLNLVRAGIPLGSQTVLLRGVNDDAQTLRALFEGLLTMRVRPYYLMQMDLTRGTAHFRTPVSTGLNIMGALRNRISGIAMPHFVVDLPGGHGKIPLTPNHVESIESDRMVLRSSRGRPVAYPLLEGERAELRSVLGR